MNGRSGRLTTSLKVGRAAKEDDGEVEDVFTCGEAGKVSVCKESSRERKGAGLPVSRYVATQSVVGQETSE